MRRYARWSALAAIITVARLAKAVYLEGLHSVRPIDWIYQHACSRLVWLQLPSDGNSVLSVT